jgi:hypothetical protein
VLGGSLRCNLALRGTPVLREGGLEAKALLVQEKPPVDTFQKRSLAAYSYLADENVIFMVDGRRLIVKLRLLHAEAAFTRFIGPFFVRGQNC